MKITYSSKIICSPEEKIQILEVLELERDLFNLCSEKFYSDKKHSIKHIHNLCYQSCKSKFPNAKSQIIIKAEQSCLSAYRSVKSNKQKIEKPLVKKRLSLQLDKRLYILKGDILILTTLGRRVKVNFSKYGKLNSLLSLYKVCDPKLFVRNNNIYISFTFDVPEQDVRPKQVIGIDLGYRRIAATSEGQLYIDKKYNKEKRKLRYLKRCLQSKGSRSAKKHLSKLKTKERNKTKDFNHNLANQLLKTKANVIAVEDINYTKLKKKKHKGKSRSKKHISLGELRRILTYKAALVNKLVVCVNPMYTSQIDCITGKKEGERKGCRFYAKSGLVYDADINAAINIAKLTKLPFSQSNLLDGQAVVNQPYVR